jgi:hypothetical protein
VPGQKPAQVSGFRAGHPEHPVLAGGEEHPGNHAGPVGSITTSNTVPAGVPANAAASTLARLSTVGSHRRRDTSRPSSASTRTVCALARPRSTPTGRLITLTSHASADT